MVVKGVCFANKVMCLQLCLNMDPVKQYNNGGGTRNISFTYTSNLSSAARVTFETAVRYHGNTPIRFITLLHRSQLQTHYIPSYRGNMTVTEKYKGYRKDKIEFIWVMSFEICF